METAFLDELASAAPTPGGGGAAAYCGALASALASMVGNLTLGNPRYTNDDAISPSVKRLEERRQNLLKLVKLDAKAYLKVAAAYKMPKDTPVQIAERDLALQSALIGACDVPLDIMVDCVGIAEECRLMACEGSRMAMPDAGAGAALAKAAIFAASLNVYANVNSMTDEALALDYSSKADKLIREGGRIADEVCAQVRERLGMDVGTGKRAASVVADAGAEESATLAVGQTAASSMNVAADVHQGELLGKPVAQALDVQTTARVEALNAKGVSPKLAIVRVGERPDDIAYERSLLKRAQVLGVEVCVNQLENQLDRQASQSDIESIIEDINANPDIHGCLMFRPLPKSVDEMEICNKIDPAKDVDGVGLRSLAGVFATVPEGFAPCTAQACMEMLDFYEVSLEGKHVVVVGRSLVVGRPLLMLLQARNATVTLAHSHTRNLQAVTRAADIVVCATGRARAFGSEYFRRGQVVLDVGMNVDEEGKLCGDVRADEVSRVVAALTPVPGGVGSVTTSVLMHHVVQAAERQATERQVTER